MHHDGSSASETRFVEKKSVMVWHLLFLLLPQLLLLSLLFPFPSFSFYLEVVSQVWYLIWSSWFRLVVCTSRPCSLHLIFKQKKITKQGTSSRLFLSFILIPGFFFYPSILWQTLHGMMSNVATFHRVTRKCSLACSPFIFFTCLWGKKYQ